MQPMTDTKTGAAPRVASCACNSLTLTATGDPTGVYACGCLNCQRATGTAFAWRARFAKTAIRLDGEHRAWRRDGSGGRWVEQTFCPTCGTMLLMSAEAMPDHVVVSAGCFADPAFTAPATFYYSRHRPAWYALDEGMRMVE